MENPRSPSGATEFSAECNPGILRARDNPEPQRGDRTQTPPDGVARPPGRRRLVGGVRQMLAATNLEDPNSAARRSGPRKGA
jgi:hypothetical protein